MRDYTIKTKREVSIRKVFLRDSKHKILCILESQCLKISSKRLYFKFLKESEFDSLNFEILTHFLFLQ